MNAVFIQPEPQAAAIWFPSTTEHSGNNSRAGKKKQLFFPPFRNRLHFLYCVLFELQPESPQGYFPGGVNLSRIIKGYFFAE